MAKGRVTVQAVKCNADGRRFTSLAGVRAHFRATGHTSYRNATARRVRVNPAGYHRR